MGLFTIDRKKGLGILFRFPGQWVYHVFYGDETVEEYKKVNEYNDMLEEIISYADRRQRYMSVTMKRELGRLKKEAEGELIPQKNGTIDVRITDKADKNKMITVSFRWEVGYYGPTYTCNCGGKYCIHANVAGVICKRMEEDLMNAYLITEKPVFKGAFVEPWLDDHLEELGRGRIPDEKTVTGIKTLIERINIPKSRDYYHVFTRCLFSIAPTGVYYDSHIMDSYRYLMFALFEDPDYFEAVVETESFLDTELYENQQTRSNRAAFKRTLKEYRSLIKDMSKGKDPGENDAKEFLLKYREDYSGLLEYYAMEKPSLDPGSDISYLWKIAEHFGSKMQEEEVPDADSGTENHDRFSLLREIAKKIDLIHERTDSAALLNQLLTGLSVEERVEIYSSLRNISMDEEEILALGIDMQKKLIHSLPINEGSLRHIMEKVLADEDSSLRGRFLVRAAWRVRNQSDEAVKDEILRQAAALPKNRVLILFLLVRLNLPANRLKRVLLQRDAADEKEIRGETAPEMLREEDPEEELTLYFRCGYKVETINDSVRTTYSISTDEIEPVVVFQVVEGEHVMIRGYLNGLRVPSERIIQVCTAGREKAFQEEVLQKEQEVALTQFEKTHTSFMREYRDFCSMLHQERVLLDENRKATITYLLNRKNGRNTLAFKVGSGKMYMVKDAAEFIRAFKAEETKKYGKGLIFTHDPENLEKEDAVVIRLLMGARYSVGSPGEPKNPKYITINNSLLATLLKSLEGREIIYNDSPCVLRLRKRELRIHVDENGTMSAGLTPDQEYFVLAGQGYVLSKEGGGCVLDRVAATSEEAGLLELVTQNTGIDIRPILEDFKKNVYARFFDLFDVDPKLKSDFRLSELRLDSFFDFEKGVITVRTDILRDEEKVLPESLTEKRDLIKLELLQGYLTELGFSDGRLEDESRVLSFFKMDLSALKRLTRVHLSETLKNKKILSIGRPVIRVSYKNDILSVFLEKSEFRDEELSRILEALKKKKKYVLLTGDRIVDLDSETAKDFGETVRDFQLDENALHREKHVSMVTAIKAFSHERSCKVDQYLKDMIEEIRNFKEAEIPVPQLLQTMREYQEEGYRWMSILCKYHMGGILADDMGLGKTIQMIALIKADRTERPSLVVCPKSLILNWRKEFANFDGETEVREIYGTDAHRTEVIESIDYNKKAVYLTSYDSLRNDIDKYQGQFCFGILDEAQFIKNVKAQKTEAVKKLKADHRFALTGTPIENSVIDLWSIFDYILPGYFEEVSKFKNADPSAIAKKAAPFILRRVKADVLEELPPKTERIVSVEMTEKQKKVYDAIRKAAVGEFDRTHRAFNMLSFLTRLRQACVDPSMFAEDYTGGSGKMELIREMVPKYLAEGHRILIYSPFVEALEHVKKILVEQGIRVLFLHGETPVKQRMEMVDSFNDGDSADIFLISLKAGGFGLNLTGADTVIHLDPWWNVAAEDQATDRAHRIGQKRAVEVIRLIAEGSVEQRVIELQEIKKAIIEEVISDDDGTVMSTRLEDIAFVLGHDAGK